jgi:SNF2 family DNA or RNA helicase
MGLGKTVQIIALITTIFKEHKRWPFLIIAPNSTLENWRREFRKWAPELRVVAWPGTSDAREYVREYELCRPKNPRDLKAHVVISGYGTARTTVSFLRKFDWEILIVDEGQALKNDKSDLFQELCTLNVHHRIVLTGTPLQNNIRELFNLMQYILFVIPSN